ncbi:MAG: hypothetical protein Q4G34_01735 [Micrococcus sp.]|nr:hypothetical protein [Micrococcus sp.]
MLAPLPTPPTPREASPRRPWLVLIGAVMMILLPLIDGLFLALAPLLLAFADLPWFLYPLTTVLPVIGIVLWIAAIIDTDTRFRQLPTRLTLIIASLIAAALVAIRAVGFWYLALVTDSIGHGIMALLTPLPLGLIGLVLLVRVVWSMNVTEGFPAYR